MCVSSTLIIQRGRPNNIFTYIKPRTYRVESSYFQCFRLLFKIWLIFVAISYYQYKYINKHPRYNYNASSKKVINDFVSIP